MKTAARLVLADRLTVSRLVIAVELIPVAWSASLTLTALLVSTAWVTDLLDGRLARAVAEEGRMGRWDLTADTAVGAGLVIGLAGSGEIPAWFAATSLVVLGALFIAGNIAASMLLQLAGYLPLLGVLWSRRPAGWWVPMVTATLIGVVAWRRLFGVNIPSFIRGVTGRFESR
jgi:hypothetical protein